jgi:hypothetical protein
VIWGVSGEIGAYRLFDKLLKEKYKPFFEGMQCALHWFSPAFCLISLNGCYADIGTRARERQQLRQDEFGF